ncbi:MAG TPA: tetratricopeptide repeat protein [Bryobacteraceae bacterium]|nr:tetratricopeptide repeat protein [Bryobacteraceae bacterium]
MAKLSPATRFSVESFFGIVVAALLVFGIASGAYHRIRHNAAADAYRQGERSVAEHDLPGALDEYNAAIQLNHKYYDALCRRAEVYQELGNYQEAEKDIKQAIAIHPLWPFALDLRRQFAQYRGKGLWPPESKSFNLKPVIN